MLGDGVQLGEPGSDIRHPCRFPMPDWLTLPERLFWKLPLRGGPVHYRDHLSRTDNMRLLDLPPQERADGEGPGSGL